jgi:Fe-S oxidoreductase
VTTTYDPFHPKYFDEADLRQEMDRVYDLCHGCRLCFKFCTSFPTLFDYIDVHDDQDSSKMTPEQQDQVVDECFQCKLCYVNCPYIPGQHEWELDFPRLMMRADQVLKRNRKESVRSKLTNYALGSTDKLGTLNSAMAPLVNKVIGTPESKPRKAIEKTVGIASERVLAPYTKQRFSTWFSRSDRSETPVTVSDKQGRAILFPTCMIEYQNTDIGKDVVKVYERNGVECDLPEGEVCCGAPFLHQGDLERFRKLADKNIKVLADAIRAAKAEGDDDVVVAACQPTCGYVLKYDYKDYVPGPDADLVAAHTRDAAEYLVDIHRGDNTELDLDFGGDVPETTTYHAPCHLRAQNIGMRSRDLLKLTGTKVTLVAECSAIDGTWGLREENVEISRKVAQKMVRAIEKADSEAVAGDCTLANGGIVLETGRQPSHPIQQVARAYGIPEE